MRWIGTSTTPSTRAFPPMGDFVGDEQPPSNKRYNLMTRRLLADPPVPAPWPDLARGLTSQGFWSRLVEVFESHLHDLDTSAIAERRPADRLVVGRRGIDSHPSADVLLDLMIATNSPVRNRPSSVRGPHVDLPNKLFSALLYMRSDDDDSEGGDLQLFRYRDGRPSGFRKYEIDPDSVECVKTIPYGRNVLVVFLNSIYAVHGVTARSVTPHPRRFLCLIGEVGADLFRTTT